ncbi:hypothetical protein OG215_41810 (plasmid) [Streptomyces globisporus]|uniref:hypothetical protein n=1 Tax=Streptomyces globisporus TaxID=1908 RepID=UPI002F91546A|nr:hypothetical protein OG215_41810 [Streptomyces globisporus]
MSMSKPTKRARIYSQYTGAPCQLACDVVAALPPGAPLIPTPGRAQMLFESEIFYRVLSGMRDFFEYPFGIQYVQPAETGIRLHLESSASLDRILAALLPVRAPVNFGDDQIYGLHGVRIVARTENGIELQRLGDTVSLKLSGPSRRAFAKAEAAFADQLERNGAEACWRTRENAWNDYEKRWADERQPIVFDETWRKAAWLPSGLLRRLGLLHTVAAPQLVSGHEARLGEWWILELDHFPDTGLRRAELVEALTDAEHGLPLTLRGHRDLWPGEQLGLVLLKAPDRSATLQLRYDRYDYPSLPPEMLAAIRQRISRLIGEKQLPLMPEGKATG